MQSRLAIGALHLRTDHTFSINNLKITSIKNLFDTNYTRRYFNLIYIPLLISKEHIFIRAKQYVQYVSLPNKHLGTYFRHVNYTIVLLFISQLFFKQKKVLENCSI